MLWILDILSLNGYGYRVYTLEHVRLRRNQIMVSTLFFSYLSFSYNFVFFLIDHEITSISAFCRNRPKLRGSHII